MIPHEAPEKEPDRALPKLDHDLAPLLRPNLHVANRRVARTAGPFQTVKQLKPDNTNNEAAVTNIGLPRSRRDKSRRASGSSLAPRRSGVAFERRTGDTRAFDRRSSWNLRCRGRRHTKNGAAARICRLALIRSSEVRALYNVGARILSRIATRSDPRCGPRAHFAFSLSGSFGDQAILQSFGYQIAAPRTGLSAPDALPSRTWVQYRAVQTIANNEAAIA